MADRRLLSWSRRQALLSLMLTPWVGLGAANAADARPWRKVRGLGQQDLVYIRYISPFVSHPWRSGNITRAPARALTPNDKWWKPINTAIISTEYREEPPYVPTLPPKDDHGIHWELSIFSKENLITNIFLEDNGDTPPRGNDVYGLVDDKVVYFRGRLLLETMQRARPGLGLFVSD